MDDKELQTDREYSQRWRARMEGFNKRDEHKKKKQSEAMEEYNKGLEKRADKIRNGDEKDVHFFNDMAALSLEVKRNRSNDSLKSTYPQVFKGESPHYDLEYQITGSEKPKYRFDDNKTMDVEARLFATTKEGREDVPGFLYVMDTAGQWYMQTIRPDTSEKGAGKWRADQKLFKINSPKQVADLLDQAGKNNKTE